MRLWCTGAVPLPAWPLLAALAWACGSSGDTAVDAAPPAADARPPAPDAMAAVIDATPPSPDAMLAVDAAPGVPVVPDPGTGKFPNAWPDTEPNDTPEQAVRIGTGSGQIGPYVGLFGAAGGRLGPGDDADSFVFATAASPPSQFIANACWDATLGVNLIDFALYKVIDGQPLIPITSSRGTSTVCERQEPFQIELEPSTKYLFVVTRVEGQGEYTA